MPPNLYSGMGLRLTEAGGLHSGVKDTDAGPNPVNILPSLTTTHYSHRPLVELYDLSLSPLLTHRCWLLLWGVLDICPTQVSVLLAQQLPQQLTSPRYPEPYLRGQESHSDIEAPEGFAVRLFFQDFDLEPSPGCEGDSVIVSLPTGALGGGAFSGQWEVALP